MQKSENFDIKLLMIELFGTVLGAFVMAIGVSLFLLPNQLSSGGVSGIATITYYIFNIPMGRMILFINIPLFLIAIYKVGKVFFVKSIVGTFALSIFIDLFDKLQPLTQDRLLASLYGGIIIGLGTAILLKSRASTGGSDLLSFIARAYNPTIRTSSVITLFDVFVVVSNVLVFREIEIGMYSAIAIYLTGKMIDIAFEGIYVTKLLVIISDKSEQIAKEIEEKVQRGVTGLYGKGMYTDNEKLVLLCAAPRRDVSRIKLISKRIDKNSFMIVTNSREVVGLGFKKLSE